MASHPITFFCSACGIKLTVPGSLAGVIGPCPSCRSQIQAPSPSPAYQIPQPPPQIGVPVAGTPAYQTPPAPAQQVPVPIPQAVPLGASSPSPTPAELPAYQQPAALATALAPTLQPPAAVAPPVEVSAAPQALPTPIPVSHESGQTSSTSSPAVLRPEPRQLPNRTSTAEPVAKPMPETNHTAGSSKQTKGRPSHSDARRRMIRLLVPLLFIIPLVLVVFGVLTLLKNQSDAPTANRPEALVEPTRTTSEDFSVPPAKPAPGSSAAPALPVPVPEQPMIVEPPPTLPDGIEPADPGQAAEEVLEKFLTAKSLAERLPFIETKTTEPELVKSCLASPFPSSSNIFPDFRETNPVEEVIDFYYNVDFDAGGNKLDPHTILIRKRGSSDPKVVVDPFLDSFGGRLARYARTPTEKAGIFQVIIYAVASCNDENVPNREKKLTLKLLPRDNTKEIARAYFGRQSKIGRMLEDGTYDLSFGKARACTVMLRWNMDDRPETPFLEALDLKTFDWNP